MTQWKNDLSKEDLDVLKHDWGSHEFGQLVATILLSGASFGFSRTLKPEDRVRWSAMQNNRRMQQSMRGHVQDPIERIYNHLLTEISETVEKIDAKNGKNGEAAMQWIDGKITNIQRSLSDLYRSLVNG